VGELSGAFAASVTPLRDDGRALDEEAIDLIVDFLAEGGVRGILALGTAGEAFCSRSRSAGGRPSASSRPRASGLQ
jgi:dihydrodipicolinate synthase/N-acetylneuraminate lyase